MRVTVIPVDKTIVVDSNPLILEEWDFDDTNIHAIQWYHDYGYVEYVHSNLEEPRPDNDKVTDQSIITKYVDAYFSEIPKLQSKKIKEEEDNRLRKIAEDLELKKYEEENNIKYDLVVKTRFDLCYLSGAIFNLRNKFRF